MTDYAKFIADLVANLGDGPVPVPELRFVGETTKQIIEVVEKVKDNKEKKQELPMRTTRFVEAMIEGMKDMERYKVDERLERYLKRFGSDVEEILIVTRELASACLYRRIAKRSDDWIGDRWIDGAFHQFLIYNTLAIQFTSVGRDSNASDPMGTAQAAVYSIPSAWTRDVTQDVICSPMPLAAGGFSDVHQGTRKSDGKELAGKAMRVIMDEECIVHARKRADREIYVLHHLGHPNVVEFVGAMVYEDRPALVVQKWERTRLYED